MPRLSDKLRKLEDRAEAAWTRIKPKLPRYAALTAAVLYLYGMFLRILAGEAFTWEPAPNLRAVFTPRGLGITLGAAVLYCLFTQKGFGLLSGRKPVLDKERGLEILPEGTHGTSGWMDKKDMTKVLELGRLDTMAATLFGRLDSGEYVGMKDLPGMSKNCIRRSRHREIPRGHYALHPERCPARGEYGHLRQQGGVFRDVFRIPPGSGIFCPQL